MTLNLNLKEDTAAAIHSLIQAGASPEQIIVVDNGSNDGSVAALRKEFNGRIVLIENQQNKGYSEGNNQGFEYAVSLGAEWVLLINNDTMVAEDFFAQFESVRLNFYSFEIIAPLIYYFSDPELIWHMGAHKIPGTLLAINRNQKKKLPADLPPVLPVDYISGCAMFIHVDVYKKIGLFDPRFFAYWEEIDFCYRARKAGFNIGVATQARMWHKVSLTANQDIPNQRYLYTRNMIFYFRKNSHGIKLILMGGYSIIKVILTTLRYLFSDKTELVRPLFQGFSEGWKASGF